MYPDLRNVWIARAPQGIAYFGLALVNKSEITSGGVSNLRDVIRKICSGGKAATVDDGPVPHC